MGSSGEFAFEFSSALVSLANCHRELDNVLQPFVRLKTWTSKDKQLLLKTLAHQMFIPEHASNIAKYLRPVILEILQHCHGILQETQQKESYIEKHELFSYNLSVLLKEMRCIRNFILEYFTNTPSFFYRLSAKESLQADLYLMISKTAYNLLSYDFDAFHDLWNWSPFFFLLHHKHPEVRWMALHIVAMITGISETNKMTLIDRLFSTEQKNNLTLAYHATSSSPAHLESSLTNGSSYDVSDSYKEEAMDIEGKSSPCFTKADFSGQYTAIAGIILPSLKTSPQVHASNSLIMVPSTQRNLHSVALAVASGSAVLLEGPVGSGKTVLVEYMAAACGRTSPREVMKIQLGDQSDSKSLLGSYVCTDTPGEFVWQPGTLLQAVTHGHWVLLEDIDYAPMDVVSILIPLLESRTLSVPGHGNVIKAAPGFQLFATQRTCSRGSSYHVHSNSSILDRLWMRVNVQPLSKQELVEVLSKKYPDLEPIAAKLIDVYCMVSSDVNLITNSDTSYSSLAHDKRLSTTRDLMKWSQRVSVAIRHAPLLSDARDVFLEALDCFCATLSKPELRVQQAMALGAKLGMTKDKIEFFCRNYKPKVHTSPLSLTVGRVTLNRCQNFLFDNLQAPTFAHTRHSLVLLERVAACISQQEPVLLVGETGTGKTSSVQNLAYQCGYKLKVINMSQQSDSADLLGGFKPVEMKQLVKPVKDEFEILFCSTFSRKQNVRFLSHVQRCYLEGSWEILFKLMTHSLKAALERVSRRTKAADDEVTNKQILPKWQKLSQQMKQLRKQYKHAESALAFRFVEGMLVKAVKNGDWLLLDEINLATPETLECLSGLLESAAGSVVLLERGDVEPIVRHGDFRVFACMNPATDVGKKNLPPGIRNRFTEIFVDELDDVSDLKVLVVDYLQGLSLSAAIVDGIVRFYLNIRQEANDKLMDGTGHKPHYSLRTLCRALCYASTNPHGNALRSIYEGFCLSFLTQLDRPCHPVVQDLIRTHILGHVNAASLLNQPLPKPRDGARDYVNFEGFWVAVGDNEPVTPKHYVLTPSVKDNLKDLARVVSGRSFPVLLQGETSVGKTSLITWLASTSGNHCVRINNHEHTDIQEYLGCYTSDQDGRLVFKEGVLVDAMRKGYWIILDELNLAPTDVLEALNRLLDDNRELFIPETQETVKAHPMFMLFATQNPPGQYGGRKVLSRAFRNRFVELHFSELPSKELEIILHERGSLPMSYAKKLVAVLLELQKRRRSTSVFAGKQGFITLRDLFRWAERYSKNPDVNGGFHDWEQHLAEDGYMLLSGRCRYPEERDIIKEVLEKNFKRTININDLFGDTTLSGKIPLSARNILDQATREEVPGFGHVVWTHNMRRLAVLVGRALQFGEPVLLVGETGCGKTTICQLFAALKQHKLYSVNCHMHSESSDFLGGLRPIRHRTQEAQDGKLQKFFEWCDGPLVQAMKEGAMFLVDEISLADDSVLERLNSVLEPERTLVLAEKGTGEGREGQDVDMVVAHERFRVVSTMNPGGDFGKKELSPALRNRFTEIWCPSTDSREDLIAIIEHNLKYGICVKESAESPGLGFGEAMMDFIEWFQATDFGRRFVFSIRDLLSWVSFMNTCHGNQPSLANNKEMQVNEDTKEPIGAHLSPATAYIHGACLVFVDSLGAGISSFTASTLPPQKVRQMCLDFLRRQVGVASPGTDIHSSDIQLTSDTFGIGPFTILRGPLPLPENFSSTYALGAPTTSQNALRILRALQLPRPILLEGSPGVGKTSLVMAIARASGHELVRINLSEQTDITDLFGADLPVEGGDAGQFAWRDGPLLRALKAGHWIVLDELNLASQSVLEGLNACLDHRAEVYIPELGMTFKVQHESTRLFACQNPLNQGGGRKGLPKSFLNRFTQVFVEALSMEDLMFIAQSMYPQIDKNVLTNMINFNQRLHQETVVESLWGMKGSPWEFNLRDVFRWCDLLLKHQSQDSWRPHKFVRLIYSDRMRTSEDKRKVIELFQEVFGATGNQGADTPRVHITPSHVQVGHSFLPRRAGVKPSQFSVTPLHLLHHDLPYMESLMKCLEMNWMALLPMEMDAFSDLVCFYAAKMAADTRSLRKGLLLIVMELQAVEIHYDKERVEDLRSAYNHEGCFTIGPRSCGKTSLVQMVAQLTRNKLEVMAMNSAVDTTELLGGFEQDDLNRHWEQLVLKAKDVVLDTIRHALAKNVTEVTDVQTTTTSTEMTDLYKNWKSFMKFNTKGEVKTAHGGGGLTKSKLQMLEKIMEIVLQTRAQDGLPLSDGEDVKESLLGLKTRFEENNCSTHCGGQFEWVDGQLVEALKTGSWLLIDNVNFCSPSVLDRLNALLEPGGVLHINERGVIDGEVPAIRPHPEFRLILTMDPKYGEVSRAMRNRGVEIYIQGEDDDQGFDDSDLHSMLNGAGLHDGRTRERLLKFHESYKSKLGGSILHLLHAAQMITDLRERGSDMRTALSTAVNQVYVKSHVSDQEREVASGLVAQIFISPTDEEETSSTSPLHSRPSVNDFSTSTVLGTVKWHCMPFVELLWKQASPRHLKHALSVAIERASLCDWQLQRDFLLGVMEDERLASFDCIHSLPSVVRTCFQELFTSVLMVRLTALFRRVADLDDDSTLVYYQPYDLRLNEDLLQRLTRHNGDSLPDVFNVMATASNRLHLLDMETKKSHLNQLTDSGKRRTFIKLSQDFHKGLLSSDFLPHPCVAHLYPLFQILDAFIKQMINLDQPLADCEFFQAQDALLWRDRLWYSCCCDSPSHMSTLSLHWQWFMEKAMNVLPNLLSPGTKSATPSDLVAVVTQLSSHLGSDTRLAKLHYSILTQYGHPKAFQAADAYEKWERVSKLAHSLDVRRGPDTNEYQRQVELEKLNVMMDKGPSLRVLVVDTMADMLLEMSVSSKGNRVLEDSAAVKRVEKAFTAALSHYGLTISFSGNITLDTTDARNICMQTTDSDVTQSGTKASPQSIAKAVLLPLFHALSYCQELTLISKLVTYMVDCKLQRLQVNEEEDGMSSALRVFYEYSLSNTVRDPGILACLKLIAMTLKEGRDPHHEISCSESKLTLSWMLLKPFDNLTQWLASLDVTTCEQQMKTSSVSIDEYSFSFLGNMNINGAASTRGNDDSADPLALITIGNFKEKQQQLQTIRQHFWCSSDVTDNQEAIITSNRKTLLASKLAQVISSFAMANEDGSFREKALSLSKLLLHRSSGESLEPGELETVAQVISDHYAANGGEKNASSVIHMLLVDLFRSVNSSLEREVESNWESILVGGMWAKLGLLQTLILAPIGPVDPMEQNAIELRYVKEEICEIKDEVYVRLYAEHRWTGSSTTLEDVEDRMLNSDVDVCGSFTSNPVRMAYLLRRWKELMSKEASLSESTAFRPSMSQYDTILSSVKQYSSTIGNPDNVLELLQQTQTLARRLSSPQKRESVDSSTVNNVLHRLRMWSYSQQQFIIHMEEEYPLYGDVLTPYLSAAAQIVYGMTLARRSLERLLSRHGLMLKCPALDATEMWYPERLIRVLCDHSTVQSFPFAMTRTDVESAMECILGMLEMTNLDVESKGKFQSHLHSRLLWWTLIAIRDKAMRTGYLSNDVVSDLVCLYDRYLQHWTLAKEEQLRKEQEEGSMYKFKSSSHGSALTESERNENEICKAFPSYNDEFSDLNPSNSLEEVTPKRAIEENNQQSNADGSIVSDVTSIAKVHELLFNSLPGEKKLGASAGLPVAKNINETEAYLAEVLQTGYQTAAVVSRICSQVEGLGCDGINWQAHLLQCSVMDERLVTPAGEEDKVMQTTHLVCGKRNHYDIYHDANIPEVTRARAVLDAFTSRINELLTEWPGNPVLIHFQSFIDRILSLSVTSPLMKVLTGVELLLKNAQEWEANASRHVSVKENLDSLTQLIISWRKLELRCWSSLLDVATDKAADKASHWWFYLYGLLRQVQDDIADGNQSAATTLIDPLQKFIESSSLGEFDARMRILLSFYNQYVSIEGDDHQTSKDVDGGTSLQAAVSSVIFNVYMYYKQFYPMVQESVLQAREPIEKELKDFVKIAKWNDANFWAMKQAAEKSHRTLHKFVSKYEMALDEPIRKLLMDTRKVLGTLETEEVNAKHAGFKFQVEWFICREQAKAHNDRSLSLADNLASTCTHSLVKMPSVEQLERLPKLYSRMKKLCHDMLTQQKYPGLVSTIEEFTGEIIESVHELQSLSVDSHPKEKRAEARKHIHLRKRKALAELFKTLQLIGLSYRKGLNVCQQSSLEDSPLLIPPFSESIASSRGNESRSDLVAALTQLFDGCQHYYHRCLARSASLSVTMTTPSKELTLGDVDRCKGYAHHLLRVAQSQRQTLATVTNDLVRLRLALTSLSGVSSNGAKESPKGLPPQDELPSRVVELMATLSWTSEMLQRASLLVKCCPAEALAQEGSPVPLAHLSQVIKSSSSSLVMTDVRDTLQQCLVEVKNLADDVIPRSAALSTHVTRDNELGKYILASWNDFRLLSKTYESLNGVREKVKEILRYFTSSFTAGSGLGGILFSLVEKLRETYSKHGKWSQDVLTRTATCTAPDILRDLVADIYKTVTALLLGVQRVAKATDGDDRDSSAKDTEAEDDKDLDLLSGHLTSRIHGNLIDEVNKLDLACAKSSVASLIARIKHFAAESSPTSEDGSDSQMKEIPSSVGHITSTIVWHVLPLLRQFVALSESYLYNLLSSHRATCKLLSVILSVFTELAAKGFCLPPDVEEEEGGEGATEFEDIEGGGMGEGEGAKDVSDQIESQDQLQDTQHESQQDNQQEAQQQQIPDEENGIEMSEDFDGALHDVEAEDKEDESGNEEEEEEPDVDKQMGEVDGQENETLDEKMWGDSDDEEQTDEKESKEEKGAGAEAESESKMVAKEDNKDAVDQSKHKEEDEHSKEDEVHELPQDKDQGNMSDEEQAEPQGEEEESTAPPGTKENMELPEDLQLDDQEGNDEQGEKEEAELCGDEDEGMHVDEDDTEKPSKEDHEDHDVEEGEEDQADGTGKQDEKVQDDGDEEEKSDKDIDWKTKHESEAQNLVPPLEDQGNNEGSEAQEMAVDEATGQPEPAENKDQQGVGAAKAAGSEGHVGEADMSRDQSKADANEKSRQRKEMNRSRSDRSLGSTDETTQKKLKTIDETETENPDDSDIQRSSDLYQHMREEKKTAPDAQTFDSATADQAKEQEGSVFPEQASDVEDEEEMKAEDAIWDNREEQQAKVDKHEKSLLAAADTEMKTGEEDEIRTEEADADDDGDDADNQSAPEGQRTTYHVSETVLFLEKQNLAIDAEKLRSDLEHQLSVWSHLESGSRDEQRQAQEAWQKYELLTAGLAQELCEQLRLVLEPSLATKLKGDYRTGKRLNMRKVIPYIASQFRKDKIWLRRTKPSKRQYQIMLAVDDSSSMVDNHSKQLAFESLAVISKALTRLEAGELAVCSFGESVKLLHPLHETFTDQSGARILQQFTFDQKKTKLAQLVDTCTNLMLSSRSRMQSSPRADTSQLLLIVSDGRGVFLEGKETVLRAVRMAKEAGIFLVFVILDNPINRDSVLDIKVPIFRPGKLPEIKSYMEQFPFPFYVILRDINALPVTLSDALRQWFELVTSLDS